MKEILTRLTSRSPKLFRQIQRYCAGIIGIAVSVLALEATHSIELPEKVSTACTYAIIGFTILGGFMKLPVEGGYEKEDNAV
jgi:heme A synthase